MCKEVKENSEKRIKVFKIEIGTHIKDDNRDIIILDRCYKQDEKGYKIKYYKYRCNKCSFDGNTEYYKNGELFKEHWISEYNLLKGRSCPCCTNSKVVVPHINSIVSSEETMWMVDYFQGGYDEAKKYTPNSGQKLYFKCPDCEKIKDKKMLITTLCTYRSIGCSCRDNKTYPEKFICSILSQLNIDFTTELSKATFNWCGDKRYDFYFTYNKENYIIEAHGGQHYNGGFKSCGGKSKNLEQQNDEYKKHLATSNGIKEENYIIIDCRKSELDWIKKSILNSKLNKIFDLSEVDWLQCEEYAIKSNLIKEICDYWNNKEDWETTTDVGEMFNVDKTTIIRYLKIGNVLTWCNYNPKEEMKKNGSKNAKTITKYIEMFKDNESLGIFKGLAELKRQSEELFNVKLSQSAISSVCHGNAKHHKGYTFKYVNQQ